MIAKTNRNYQSSLCDFLITFQGVVFMNGTDKPVHKQKLFSDIYENHIQVSPEIPFVLVKDVTFQLLKANNHPVYRTVAREFVDFNEAQALKEASDQVFRKLAFNFVHHKVKKEMLHVNEIIELVSTAMAQAYEHHKDIDKEIEKGIQVV